MTVNWWFVALAFVLGLVITAAFMIRKVEREVPVYGSAGGGGAASAAQLTAAGAAGGAAAAKLVGTGGDSETAEPAAAADEPYGVGSIRIVAGADVPSGYTIKGNENSMLYHTPDSPSYKVTIAEIWFRDEDTAARAGFTPWHRGRRK